MDPWWLLDWIWDRGPAANLDLRKYEDEPNSGHGRNRTEHGESLRQSVGTRSFGIRGQVYLIGIRGQVPVGLLFHTAYVTFWSLIFVRFFPQRNLKMALVLAGVLWLVILAIFFPIVGWGVAGRQVSPKLVPASLWMLRWNDPDLCGGGGRFTHAGLRFS